MKLGLHIGTFTWDGGPTKLSSTLAELATLAEDVGFDNLTVMDHVWQISINGPKEWDMLEGYTALGYLAAITKRVRLMTLVTGVTYRSPGLLAKEVTTLDVLSNGRAALGIGAGWNAEEAAGLGLGFAPLAQRFEMLEEALQICLQMWSDNNGPYEGKHYQLESTLNVPQSIKRPRPPIMVAGGGEKKTLRMVAQYADACNLFSTSPEEVKRKLDILRGHCDAVGRDYDSIQKTIIGRVDPEGDVSEFLSAMEQYAALGVSLVEVAPSMPDPARFVTLLGDKVVRPLASIG
jgi:F420-dependent oxidoreductase-like protein